MLSNPQKALIAQGKRQAQLTDDDYRDVLESVTGFRSSTAPSLTDRDCDLIMSFLEAIYWRRVDKGETSETARKPFYKRSAWKERNPRADTSRSRFVSSDCSARIAALEAEFAELGYGDAYCASIRKAATKGVEDARSLHIYEAALKRTLRSKQRQAQANPF